MTRKSGDRDVAQNWIDGAWVDSEIHADSFDPATTELIGTYASATRGDIERAIQSAKRAFETTTWRADRQWRARVLNTMADRFEARQQDLIDLLSLDNGKVKAEAALDIANVAPIPPAAYGDLFLPERIRKGYYVEEVNDGVSYVTSGAYDGMFVASGNGVAVVDTPPLLGTNYLRAISEVTDEPVTHLSTATDE